MDNQSGNSLIAGVTVAALLLGGAALADPAPGAASEPALDEIVVTAEKRSERVVDVPLSVTAVTGEQLVRQGITSANDLERVVPGFSYQQSSLGVPVFTIRGVG